MKKLSLILFAAISGSLFSQFTSPGSGITYTLSSLSAAAPSVLIKNGDTYQMAANITIAAGDTLLMDEAATLRIDGGVQLTIAGTYLSTTPELLITATDPATIFKGIRLEEGSTAEFKNTTLEYGGGIQVLTENFLMEDCTVRYFKSGLVSGAAINFSRGMPIVRNSTFLENDLPAVASPGNSSVALEFTGNYLKGNSKSNSNRPQINMAASGAAGITKVLNNVVIGDRSLTKVGGISVSSLLGITNHVQIEGNTVTDNRYGITVAGNASSGVIANNVLTNNNTEPVPNNGGSGISLNGSGTTGAGIKIEKNQIRGHLWGITLIGTFTADLGGGPLGSAGENIFSNNGNGGTVYALYNNTALPVSAKNNCWREGEVSTTAMVEEVITHSVDNPALGTVDFTPFLCGEELAVNTATALSGQIYPNPSNGEFTFKSENSGTLVISDFTGKIIHSTQINRGTNTISLRVPAGAYIATVIAEGKKHSSKIIIR